MERAEHDRSRQGSESMYSTITHSLDGTRQAQYGSETCVKLWIRDHSRTVWDTTSAIRP